MLLSVLLDYNEKLFTINQLGPMLALLIGYVYACTDILICAFTCWYEPFDFSHLLTLHQYRCETILSILGLEFYLSVLYTILAVENEIVRFELVWISLKL